MRGPQHVRSVDQKGGLACMHTGCRLLYRWMQQVDWLQDLIR